MNNVIRNHPALAILCAPSSKKISLLYFLGLVSAGVLFLTGSAYITIPLMPVPITMQTYAVIVLGLTYGWALAGTTVATYLFIGAMGAPVFAGAKGGVFFNIPTGGYLFGFLIAAMVMGYLASNKKWSTSNAKSIFASCIGTIIIYMCGLPWLAYTVPSLDTVQKVLAAGLYPFIIGGIIKSILAGVTVPMLWKIMKRM